MTDSPADMKSLLSALAASGDVAYDWNLVDDTVTWQGAFADMFGHDRSKGMQTGDDFNRLINPEDMPRRLKELSRHFARQGPYDCEFRTRSSNGKFCWVHDRGKAQFTQGGRPIRMQGVLRAITARKRNEARLEHLANYDELTGHFNRTRLRESLDHTLDYAQRYDSPGAYLVIGIDKLSMISDAFGHETADSVIVTVGQRLERCLRSSDVIGRIGGDRYGVVLSNCSESSAIATVEKILSAVRMKPLEVEPGTLNVTVSVGLVTFPGLADTIHDIMIKAETAFLEAKRRGRNRVVSYSLSDDQRDKRRKHMDIAEQVRTALKEDRLFFAYQPVIKADTREIAYHECLLRMRGADGEITSAGDFIEIVEQLGLARAIDHRVLEMAVDILIRHPDARLSLNISGITAADQSWLRALAALLKGKPEIGRRLIVEITETAAMHDIEESARFITAVRDLECRVSLDDFGSGYTSFRHLKSLPVDVLKIDGSFILNLASSPDNQLFVKTMQELAEGFGVKTVAECVATREDADILSELGIGFLQGHFCGRPDTAEPWR